MKDISTQLSNAPSSREKWCWALCVRCDVWNIISNFQSLFRPKCNSIEMEMLSLSRCGTCFCDCSSFYIVLLSIARINKIPTRFDWLTQIVRPILTKLDKQLIAAEHSSNVVQTAPNLVRNGCEFTCVCVYACSVTIFIRSKCAPVHSFDVWQFNVRLLTGLATREHIAVCYSFVLDERKGTWISIFIAIHGGPNGNTCVWWQIIEKKTIRSFIVNIIKHIKYKMKIICYNPSVKANEPNNRWRTGPHFSFGKSYRRKFKTTKHMKYCAWSTR